HTAIAWPAFMTFSACGRPMIPSPTNATFIIYSSNQTHLPRRIHFNTPLRGTRRNTKETKDKENMTRVKSGIGGYITAAPKVFTPVCF
ncbi:MAG: hypothetical protein ACREVZ_15225, partial [Burkholderiales bacterium]